MIEKTKERERSQTRSIMELINVPLNHKTILLFDHSVYFGSLSGQTIEIDVGPSGKPGGGPTAAAAAAAAVAY